MQRLQSYAFTILMVGLGSMAHAWDHEMQRGLDLYTTPDDTVALVCDPNSVYGTTESAVLIQTGSDPFETKDLTFRFVDGNAVQARLEKGRVAKALTESLVWETLISGFRKFGVVIIEDDNSGHEVTLGDPMMFSCT